MKKMILRSVLLSGLLSGATGCSIDVHGSGAGSGRAHACTEVCVDGTCTTSCGDGGTEIACAGDDRDCDGLSDADEALCNTSPDSPDTDGDGILDPDEDPDGDGFSNADEIAAGSDPADGASVPGCAWEGACWDDGQDGCTDGCTHPHGPCGGGGFYGGDTTISCASAGGPGLVLPALLLIAGLALPRRRRP